MNILEKWEVEAKESIYGSTPFFFKIPVDSPLAEKILTLIDLVRKKDEALRKIMRYLEDSSLTLQEFNKLNNVSDKALALNEELK